MIRYSLSCEQKHGFESWFASAAAFDKLHLAGMLSCAVCGSARIEKELMAPALAASRAPAPLSTPASPVEEALAQIRRAVEENSEYVGLNFADEARAMHDGERPNRAIYGEARADEARALIEDGVPVAPLPFLPRSKAN